MKRKLFFGLLCLVGLYLCHEFWVSRQAKVELAKRESGYAAIAESWQRAIKPGMRRSDAERILKERAAIVEERSGAGTLDDLVLLAHETSPVWYCNWTQVMVLVEFTPGDSAQSNKSSNPIGYESRPDDRVKSVSLDHGLQDCL